MNNVQAASSIIPYGDIIIDIFFRQQSMLTMHTSEHIDPLNGPEFAQCLKYCRPHASAIYTVVKSGTSIKPAYRDRLGRIYPQPTAILQQDIELPNRVSTDKTRWSIRGGRYDMFSFIIFKSYTDRSGWQYGFFVNNSNVLHIFE